MEKVLNMPKLFGYILRWRGSASGCPDAALNTLQLLPLTRDTPYSYGRD